MALQPVHINVQSLDFLRNFKIFGEALASAVRLAAECRNKNYSYAGSLLPVTKNYSKSGEYMSIRHSKTRQKSDSIWHRDITELFSKKRTLRTKDLVIFCRELSFLLSALPAKDAIPVLNQQFSGPVLKPVVSDICKGIMRGESFTEAIRNTGAFPAFVCGYISIGEKTAQLPEVLARLADFYDRLASTREELTAALVYPALVCTMVLGVIVMAVAFVIPGYADIFAAGGVSLPTLTVLLIRISDFFTAYWLFVFAGVSALAVLLRFYLHSKSGRVFVSELKLKIPILRLNVNLRLTQSLSLLLSSGVTISDAIPLCREVMDNIRVKEDLKSLNAEVHTGTAFWKSLSKIEYIDPVIQGLVKVGEETGRLPQTIDKCRIHFEEAHRRALVRMNKLAEPIITIVLGVILAVVILAVILPTFELATVM